VALNGDLTFVETHKPCFAAVAWRCLSGYGLPEKIRSRENKPGIVPFCNTLDSGTPWPAVSLFRSYYSGFYPRHSLFGAEHTASSAAYGQPGGQLLQKPFRGYDSTREDILEMGLIPGNHC